MSHSLRGLGAAAALALGVLLVTAILVEPYRRETARTAYLLWATNSALPLYLEQCAHCHGLAGEGIDTAPALRDSRGKDDALLFNVIYRGRYGTEMVAFGLNEGGFLTDPQIDGLVKLIQHGSWDAVAMRGVEMQIAASWTPTPLPTLTPGPTVSAPPSSESPAPAPGDTGTLAAQGVTTYNAKCSECHGIYGEGKPPDVADLGSTRVKRLPDEELLRIINFGVENTEMRPWRSELTEEEKQAVIYLIRHLDLLK